MSQVSAMAGDGQSSQSTKTPTGRAVFLLAIFVVLGIALLHELDKAPAAASANGSNSNNASSSQTQNQTRSTTAQQSATAAQTQQSTTTLAARTPGEVKVLVANGIGVNGVAARVAQKLQPVGYNLLKPGNTTNKITTSAVEYADGYQTEAQAVATTLGLQASVVTPFPNPAPLTDMQGANVLVIVGNDLAATGTASGASSGTSTTLATGTNNQVNGPLTNTAATGTGTATNSSTSTTVASNVSQ